MAKTGTFPAMEDEYDSKLTELALDYVDKLGKRMAATKNAKAAKDMLIGAMAARKLSRYHDDEANLTVTMETDMDVKVRIGGDGDEN